jgi:integrase
MAGQNSNDRHVALTTKGIKDLDPLAAEILWDAAKRGFGLRTRKQSNPDKWRWVVSYRTGGRGSAQTKLSQPFLKLTPEQARRWAEDAIKRSNTPDDLAVLRRAAKAKLEEQLSQPTMATLWEEYWKAEGRHKKANYTQLWTQHLLPSFGNQKVRDVSVSDVERFKGKMVDRMGACNRALALLSCMMNKGAAWGYRDGCAQMNPAIRKLVTRYPENAVEFYFKDHELGRILEAADQDLHHCGGLIIRMLALTGARASEVATARWGQLELVADVEGGGAYWTVESTNTKVGRPITRKLSKALTDRLLAWKATSIGIQKGANVTAIATGDRNLWMFPLTSQPSKPVRNLSPIWRRIKKAAGVTEGRIHDLRHTAATMIVKNTGSLYAAQMQLGHTTSATTNRYAHVTREGITQTGDTLGRLGESAEAAALDNGDFPKVAALGSQVAYG